MASVLTAFERLLRTLAFLYSELTWGVVDDYAFSCIYRHLGCREWEHIRDEDCPHTVVMDHQVLLPYPVDFLRLVDFDVIDQFIEHPGGQGLGSSVFADGGDKHVRRYGLTTELVHFRTEGLDFLRYLLLFILIPTGHFGKAVIRELTGNIVLIDTLEQSIQFFITSLQGCKLFLFESAVQGNILLGAAPAVPKVTFDLSQALTEIALSFDSLAFEKGLNFSCPLRRI